MGRTVAIFAVAAGLAVLHPGQAVGRSLPRITGPTQARFLGTVDRNDDYAVDPGRYVVFPAGGGLRVYDMAGDSHYDLAGCESVRSSSASGKFLVACGEGGYRILDAADGRLDPVPGLQPDDQLFNLGAHWIDGLNCSPGAAKCPTGIFLNWRTGERRECDTYLDERCSADILDIDSEDLGTVRRMPRFAVGVEPPYVLELLLTGATVFEERGRLVLSGGKRKRVLDHGWFCRESDCSPMLDAGRITWTHQNWGRPASLLIGLVARSGRRFTWRVKDGHRFSAEGVPSGEPRIDQVHTRFGIVVAVDATLDKPAGRGDRREPLSWRLYVIPWPRQT